MIYIMSDIHGCYNEFITMLEKINFSNDDTLYIIGDIIDRGYDIVKLIRYVRSHSNIIMLKGNHEDMAVEASVGYWGNSQAGLWFANGGLYTKKEFDLLNDKEREDIIEYFRNLPLYKIVEMNGVKYFLVHSGYTGEEDDYKLWYRMTGEEKALNNYTVIFGHTNSYHYQYIFPMEAWVRNDKKYICIDCGLSRRDPNKSQLCCLRLDDMRFFYVPFVGNGKEDW